MTIYTDEIHIVSDTSIEELHKFAAFVGIKQHWFHNPRKGRPRPHYDIPKKMPFIKVIQGGAIRVSYREIVRAIERLRKNI